MIQPGVNLPQRFAEGTVGTGRSLRPAGERFVGSVQAAVHAVYVYSLLITNKPYLHAVRKPWDPILAGYRPRNPEDSLLYQVVADELETFLVRQHAGDRCVPWFVERELRAFLDCGVLSRGFLRVHCDACKKALAEREERRNVLARALRQLARFVQIACNDDMATFMTSGFQPATYARTAPQPLRSVSILRVDQGINGQLLVRVRPLPKALQIQVRYAPVDVTGSVLTEWATAVIPSAKRPAILNNLTPGVSYAIQARAYGSLGYTGWSDAVTRMVI